MVSLLRKKCKDSDSPPVSCNEIYLVKLANVVEALVTVPNAKSGHTAYPPYSINNLI